MSRIWNSLRWRIVAYYTTLLAVAIGVVLALGYRNETRHLSQLHVARMQAGGLGMLPFFSRLPQVRAASRGRHAWKARSFSASLRKSTRSGCF